MPIGAYAHTGPTRSTAVDTSDYDVPVTKVTQFVMKNGKKMKKVSTVYQKYLLPATSKEEADYYADQLYQRNYRVVHEYFEIDSS